VSEALEARHFGQLLYAYRHEHRPVLTQARVGRWLGLTQSQVSRLERSTQPIHDLNRLDHWAHALRIPEHLLWFRLSPKQHPASPGSRVADSGESEAGPASSVARAQGDASGDPQGDRTGHLSFLSVGDITNRRRALTYLGRRL
jgi:transcriptional regulator with XRE-family HTH domain